MSGVFISKNVRRFVGRRPMHEELTRRSNKHVNRAGHRNATNQPH